jgi:hypothetical protein
MDEGADKASVKAEVMEAVRAHFRPEFLNRLDETMIFDRLSRGIWIRLSISRWRGSEAVAGAQDHAGTGCRRAHMAGRQGL